jgi:hypothetical protein
MYLQFSHNDTFSNTGLKGYLLDKDVEWILYSVATLFAGAVNF